MPNSLEQFQRAALLLTVLLLSLGYAAVGLSCVRQIPPPRMDRMRRCR